MKTTQNISLGGYAFVIEEDALASLEEYLAKVGDASTEDVRDELVSDIEERLAELFTERCGKNGVIDSLAVSEVTAKIGSPDEFDSVEEERNEDFQSESQGEPRRNEPRSSDSKSNQKTSRRRLYRNMEDRIFGGVCSGIARYFGIEATPIRLLLGIFALVCLGTHEVLFVDLVILYVVAWIIIPAPKTVQQKCEAQGKPMQFAEFRDAVSNAAEMIKETAVEANTSPALRSIFRVFVCTFGIILSIMGLATILTGVFSIFAVPYDLCHIADRIDFNSDLGNLYSFLINPSIRWSFFAMLFVLGVALLYGGSTMIFDLKSPNWKPGLLLFFLFAASAILFGLFVARHVAERADLFWNLV